jgi:hypothetical protein
MKNLIYSAVVSLLLFSAAAQAQTQVSFDIYAQKTSEVTSLTVKDGYLKVLTAMNSVGGRNGRVMPASNPSNLHVISEKKVSKATLSLEDGLYLLEVNSFGWVGQVLFQVKNGTVTMKEQNSADRVKINLSQEMQ